MQGRMTRVTTALRSLAAAWLTAACSGGDQQLGPVTPPPPASIDVSSATGMGSIGSQQQLTATAHDTSGQIVSGVTFTWSSDRPDIATVDGGLVTAVSNGSAIISAKTGAVSGSRQVTVQQVPDSIAGLGAVDTILAAGQTRSFTAQVLDSGNTVIAGAALEWTSSDTAVATIGPANGPAIAAAPGTTTVTVSAGAVQRATTLLVRNGVLVNDLVLLTDFGNVTDNAYAVDDIFVVWWHKTQDWSLEAQTILNWLKGVRAEALAYGMHDPPTVARGTYLNVYLHEPGSGNDNYPDGWAAGVSTDSNGLPYLAVGSTQRNDLQLFRHEGFHLMQYAGVRQSPGFEYTGDGSWYGETSASWFATLPPTIAADPAAQAGAQTVPANPQLALWHGALNAPPGDPVNWNRTTRQYALSTWLDYLSNVAGVPATTLLGGYITPTTQLPQEYLATHVTDMGAIFADYAAACTPDMTFLTRPQWTRALQDMASYGDSADHHEYVA